jgi:hypothetical protein
VQAHSHLFSGVRLLRFKDRPSTARPAWSPDGESKASQSDAGCQLSCNVRFQDYAAALLLAQSPNFIKP